MSAILAPGTLPSKSLTFASSRMSACENPAFAFSSGLGSDGAADDYRLAFKGLKEIGYKGAVSLEAGWVPKGKDAKGKDILPDPAERHQILMRMCALLRAQWAEA